MVPAGNNGVTPFTGQPFSKSKSSSSSLSPLTHVYEILPNSVAEYVGQLCSEKELRFLTPTKLYSSKELMIKTSRKQLI